jgi:CBS domain-containing protein
MMQRISEVMTRDVRSIAPQETIRRAAEMMDELNVGALPVCDGERLVGMITDRDITVRAVAAGTAPEAGKVGEVMSVQVRWCFENQPVDEVMEQMSDTQIRRVPVVDEATHQLVGIVSLGDLATKHSAQVDRTLEEISSPSEPDRPQLNS